MNKKGEAKEFIGFKGIKKDWDKFVKKVKKEDRTIWGVLKPFIKEYTKKK